MRQKRNTNKDDEQLIPSEKKLLLQQIKPIKRVSKIMVGSDIFIGVSARMLLLRTW